MKAFYHDQEFWDYYKCLGEKGREEFQKWLSEINLPGGDGVPGLNYDYCLDYRNDVRRTGRSGVYLYTTDRGIPFYVGKGDAHRAVSIRNRSEDFMDMVKENDVCRIFVVASHIADSYALEIETLVIAELLRKGWRLSNIMKTTIEDSKHRELKDTYFEVLNTVDRITSVGLNSLLDAEDGFGENGRVYCGCNSYMKPVEQ